MSANLRSIGQAACVMAVGLAACVLAGWSGVGLAGAQSACADLGGTVDPGQTCHVHSATASYTLDFSFPVSYPDQQALSAYLTQQRDQFVSYAAQFPPGGVVASYDHTEKGTAYRSGTPTSGTQSLVFDIADDTGAANQGEPATSYKAFNYDLSKGAPITFDTLFKAGTTALDVQNLLAGHGLVPPSTDLPMDAYQNFAITDGAVIFFFDHDSLHQDGPEQVSVPRTELGALLAQPSLRPDHA